MPYGQIHPYLVKSGLVVPKELKLVLPPYPPGYDLNARRDFHAGEPGHSVDNWKALKYKVQELVDSKAISFMLDGQIMFKTIPYQHMWVYL